MKPTLIGVAALLALGLGLLALFFTPDGEPRGSAGALPPVWYLWVWQRGEDLSFIDPAQTRLALLTGTLTLDDTRLQVEPRANPVTYPDGTEIIAVLRIEAPGQQIAVSASQLADTIVALSAPYAPVEYQLDFDARLSQRAFYRTLLEQLRLRIGTAALSITALASWCFQDAWITDLPIDSAVAMLYRMGPEAATIRQKLATQPQFPASICQHNVGYSSDEPLAAVAELQRIFLYHPQPWSPHTFAEFKDEIGTLLDNTR